MLQGIMLQEILCAKKWLKIGVSICMHYTIIFLIFSKIEFKKSKKYAVVCNENIFEHYYAILL